MYVEFLNYASLLYNTLRNIDKCSPGILKIAVSSLISLPLRDGTVFLPLAPRWCYSSLRLILLKELTTSASISWKLELPCKKTDYLQEKSHGNFWRILRSREAQWAQPSRQFQQGGNESKDIMSLATCAIQYDSHHSQVSTVQTEMHCKIKWTLDFKKHTKNISLKFVYWLDA